MGVARGEKGAVWQPLPRGDAFFSSLPQSLQCLDWATVVSPRFYVKAQ